MKVYWRGILHEADELVSGGETFYQIGREFVLAREVALPGSPRYDSENPPVAPPPTPELEAKPPKRGRKPAPAPAVEGDADPPAGGGELSEAVEDPRG